MAFNIGNSFSGALAGAGTGASSGGYGALIGAGVGALAGGFSGSTNNNSAVQMSMQDMYNIEMYNTMKNLYMMHVQNNYNKQAMSYSNELNKNSMRYGTDLQKELNAQAFKYNNYFLDNAYQKTVADMKKAGINPILASGNSNVGSAQSGGVSSAGTSALGTSVSDTGVDGSSLLSAFANSANSKVARDKLGLDLINTVSQTGLNYQNSALAKEKVATEKTQQEINRSQVVLNRLDSIKKEIENKNWDDSMKSDIYNKLSQAEYNITMKEVNKYLSKYQAYNLVTSANAQSTSAQANLITAKEGNVEKALIDFAIGLLGDNPSNLGKKLRKDNQGKKVPLAVEL